MKEGNYIHPTISRYLDRLGPICAPETYRKSGELRPVLPAGKAENNKDTLLNKDELVNVAYQLKLFIKQNKNKPAIRIVDPVLYTLVYLNGQEPPKTSLMDVLLEYSKYRCL